MKIPRCHWASCRREMKLINEKDDFYFFACECGCTRALSKPNVRAQSARAHYEREIEKLRRLTRAQEMRPEYSFPEKYR